ncbi:MAG: acetyl/propionyl/methylcrotonyl-CoA carboxylase subunit alpha [Candidatus Binataceae bacterium]
MARRRIKKLLIANRGEIALRIIRSARVMGIETVAVYSEADAHSAHVAAADEARLIGPPEAARSYLNIDAIIAAAHETSSDAIHPGYGFLSERAEFARAAQTAGIIFVGPRADVMVQLGDKVAARKIAAASNVPVVPGLEIVDTSAAREFSQRAGFPILVKAAAGGGGRGMRAVTSLENLDAALEAASREAHAAFGDGRVFLEKYLARPHHIEVQILGDEFGNVVAMGERECSIQRRHQKVIEESPAPGLSDATRSAMIEAALRLARAAGYTNAGTAEFLVDGDQFYFLEVNARLQVEHPITEIRFGCDLVAEQLKIAMGERVSAPAAPRGCAIECRIYAEDAAHGFRPAAGSVLDLRIPAGPGIRLDTHLVQGAEVGAFYDGLLGKLICFGAEREEVRRRMVAAFDEFAILGVTNTAGFLRDVVASDPFARADLSTRFIEEFFSDPARVDQVETDAALIAAALAAEIPALAATGINASVNGASRSPWTELGGFELWRRL